MNALETIGLAALAFASTNVDDFFLLLIFFADGRSRNWQIILGQYLGVGTLVILSLAVAWGIFFLPHEWIRWLGILPVLLGVKDLLALRKPADPEKRQRMVDTALVKKRNALAIAAVTMASGGDNIGVYSPLFAATSRAALSLTVATFAVLIGVWCLAAHWLVTLRHRVIRREHTFALITSVVLILIGVWILCFSSPQ